MSPSLPSRAEKNACFATALPYLAQYGCVVWRAAPAPEYPKLGTVAAGISVELVGQYKDWLKVRTPKGDVFSGRFGTFIDKGSLAPDDRVFFANTYKRGISHVGIYVGNGMVVQALAPGVPLAAVSMNGGYWQSKYYGAIRPNL